MKFGKLMFTHLFNHNKTLNLRLGHGDYVGGQGRGLVVIIKELPKLQQQSSPSITCLAGNLRVGHLEFAKNNANGEKERQ